MRWLDLGRGLLWVEGTSIPTDYQACNADKGVHRDCWLLEQWVQATLV